MIVANGHKLLCDAHTVLKQRRGTAALFVLLTIMSVSTFSFCIFVSLTVLFFFLGASIVCVHNNLKRTADLILLIP